MPILSVVKFCATRNFNGKRTLARYTSKGLCIGMDSLLHWPKYAFIRVWLSIALTSGDRNAVDIIYLFAADFTLAWWNLSDERKPVYRMKSPGSNWSTAWLKRRQSSKLVGSIRRQVDKIIDSSVIGPRSPRHGSRRPHAHLRLSVIIRSISRTEAWQVTWPGVENLRSYLFDNVYWLADPAPIVGQVTSHTASYSVRSKSVVVF